MELLQNINDPLRKLCNFMFFANKKIMIAIMRSTKTNAMEAIMKKFMGIATAAVFGLGIFTTSAKAETFVTTDVLNVRENPTTESKVVGKLLDGYKVNVLHTENGWSKVKLNSGKEAFISADYTKDTYYVTANVLNVRAGANTDSEILGKLKQDDVIETTHQVENGWIQFEYNGKTAYVHVPYLTGKAPVKVQPVVKAEKTTTVQDTAKAVATTKAREVAETQAKAKAEEATKAREAAEAQAAAKAREAAKAQETAKAQAEAKAQEAAEAQAEAKAQEAAKAREAAKAQAVAEAQAAAKAQEAAKAREAAKAQAVAEAQAEAKAQEAAKAREAAKAQKPATQQPVAKETETSAPSSSRELRVVATAYTADPLENGYKAGDQVKSALGHNLTANPNMKLIAVDPSVIPLGSKVWVEGYGVAIAGDTGGAIKGNKIDVLMPDKGTSSNWGRKTVTVKVLN
ncbi:MULTISPECIES: cell wall-binding protein EntC [Bacillus cereus group]|uniref:cell wall-binding protein EntC n=1 Tax=Bacillus cereus group TaxID=86661 RepID=UPI0022E17A2A|nr:MULTISPECIES: cell wall-binding protein EntC [unclassified Bacillus cereus group]MDA2665282.1 cell wall-binding protein EntC [Bacillus cereus group sp. Bc032]MDA2676084.1 cell wall-binding protein EntC [Bacillus cereus group sp. Bc031]MDA2681552.1 cell wall-binding protein EntC [Bacillus cereus group sp. Bc029]MDA2687023.1 cell wall-binding protein EntC [Bacillus cereus group sp. Bc030]MDA2742511.1 cell wall-binding protein EntC [Bacillus cereus group sp. Bc011]